MGADAGKLPSTRHGCRGCCCCDAWFFILLPAERMRGNGFPWSILVCVHVRAHLHEGNAKNIGRGGG
eukprot:1420592-Alexandrium_andersonii.AAC.1